MGCVNSQRINETEPQVVKVSRVSIAEYESPSLQAVSSYAEEHSPQLSRAFKSLFRTATDANSESMTSLNLKFVDLSKDNAKHVAMDLSKFTQLKTVILWKTPIQVEGLALI